MADQRDRHADHDRLLIVSLLDDDLADAERTAAEAWIATCEDCAALYADLMALSQATRELSVPSRPRDLRLTAADAERLVAMTPREPEAAISRRTGVMNDRPTTTHAAHDTMLVAALADHSLPQAERDVAEAMVAGCRACADLHADLMALRVATVAMPTPARPRDYTLTADDVVRLRPNGWRRLVAAFGTARDTFSRPLAVGLTTMGLVGLLVASLPSIMSGSATSGSGTLTTVGAGVPGAPFQAPATNAESGNSSAVPAAAAAPTPAPSGQKDVDTAGPIPTTGGFSGNTSPPGTGFSTGQPDRNLASAAPSTGDAAVVGKGASPTPATLGDLALSGAAGQPRIPPLAIVSGLFLMVGLGLFAIRRGARRFGNG